jgi:predicted glycosyltransferase
MIGCAGIICGAGFETPAEAIHLGKKMMTIPISGQYEQQCNAAGLEKLGIRCLPAIDHNFEQHFNAWINDPAPALKRDYSNSIRESLAYLFALPHSVLKESVQSVYEDTATLL